MRSPRTDALIAPTHDVAGGTVSDGKRQRQAYCASPQMAENLEQRLRDNPEKAERWLRQPVAAHVHLAHEVLGDHDLDYK